MNCRAKSLSALHGGSPLVAMTYSIEARDELVCKGASMVVDRDFTGSPTRVAVVVSDLGDLMNSTAGGSLVGSFNSARIRDDVDCVPAGFVPGQRVSLRWFCKAYNRPLRVYQDVYSISATEHFSKSPTVFSNLLTDFQG